MPLEPDKLTMQARKRFNIAKQASGPWRDKAKEEYKFVAGHQWSDVDKQHLEKHKRPMITFNLIAPNIKAITGMEQGNRHELKYLPREKSEIDGFAASIYNQTSKCVFDRNDNEFRESQALRDMTICGMGWTGMSYDFDDDPEGMVQTPCIDPILKYWDPASKEPNLVDRRYDFTLVKMDVEHFKFLFPKTKIQRSLRVFESDIEDEWEDNVEIETRPDHYEGGDDSTKGIFASDGLIAVLQYNYFSYEDVYTVANLEGQTAEMGTVALDRMIGEGAVSDFTVNKKKRYYKAFFTGDSLIEDPQENADPNSFTDHCVTGEFDRTGNSWFGVVRAMMDPQLWANKLFSTLLHIINSNSRGGFFYRSGAFKNKNKALKDWSAGDMGIELEGRGPISDWIQERTPMPLPTALHELMMYAAGIIPRVSGFNMELLGLAGKDQPGVRENMRKQAGMTILAPFFDSLRRYRKIKGRTLLHFMREYVGVKRMARLVDDDTREKMDVITMPGVEKFDVLVDQSPHSPNQKATNFAMLLELGQTNPDVMTNFLDIVIEQSPLEQSIIRKFQERFAQAQQPDPQVEAAKQAELRKTISEDVKNEMQALLDEQKAITESGKPDLEQDKLDLQADDQVMNLAQTAMQMSQKTQEKNNE